MSIATHHVHEALRVNYTDVTIASSGFGATDQAEFVFVLLCGIVIVRSKVLLSLLHLLVVEVEAVICVLDDECVHHGDRSRRAQTVALASATLFLVCSGGA